MKTSDTLGKFAEAMAKVQAELKPAQMNAANPFLKNKYADLGAIVESCQHLAGRHGIATIQLPFTVDGGIGLTTRLIHESGEWVEGEVVFELVEERGISRAQSAGKLITYARRYALASAFGVVADEDTDGNAPPPQKAQAKQKTQRAPAAPPAAKNRIMPSEVSTTGLDDHSRHISLGSPAAAQHWTETPPASPAAARDTIMANVPRYSENSHAAVNVVKKLLNGGRWEDMDKGERVKLLKAVEAHAAERNEQEAADAVSAE